MTRLASEGVSSVKDTRTLPWRVVCQVWNEYALQMKRKHEAEKQAMAQKRLSQQRPSKRR